MLPAHHQPENHLKFKRKLRNPNGFWRSMLPNVRARVLLDFAFRPQSFQNGSHSSYRLLMSLRSCPLCLSDCSRHRFDLPCRRQRSSEFAQILRVQSSFDLRSPWWTSAPTSRGCLSADNALTNARSFCLHAHPDLRFALHKFESGVLLVSVRSRAA